MKSWKPEISTDGGKTFGQNGQAFATSEEAEAMARDIFSRWMLATDYRASETTDPVNYRLIDNKLEPVASKLGDVVEVPVVSQFEIWSG